MGFIPKPVAYLVALFKSEIEEIIELGFAHGENNSLTPGF